MKIFNKTKCSKVIIANFILWLGFSNMANAQQKLMHYWHFNSFVGLSVAVVPSTIAPYRADFSTNDTSLVKVKFTTIPNTSTSYKTYWDVSTGDTVNLKNGVVAGNCLRLRNPSDSMQLQFFIPSTYYKNINLKYEVQKSSASNGAANNIFAYSIDSGVTWLTSGLSVTSYTVVNYSGGTPAWPLTPVSVNITDSLAFNNPKLVFRITFAGSGSTGTSGNNRIDNFSVEGDSIIYPTINYSSAFAPFISEKNATSNAQNFSLSAVGLTDTLWVNAPNHFKIALTENGSYTNSIFFVPVSGIVNQTIYTKFYPTDTGSFSGNISISSLGATTKNIAISGTTLPVPNISIVGLPISTFSNTQPNTFSAYQRLTINAANLKDTLWLNTNSPFRISFDSISANSKTTLFILDSTITEKYIYIFFNPINYGLYADTLKITSLNANSFSILLAGSSIANPSLTISKDTLNTFSQIVVGSVAAYQSFLVDGKHLKASLNLTVKAPFKIGTTTSGLLNSITLNPIGDSVYQIIYVTFNPIQLGEVIDTISIISTDFTKKIVTVKGTTFDPFVGLNTIYQQNFTTATNLNPPAGWAITDTALWSFVSSNPSANYAYASGGNCLKFDNEGSELPKTAFATLSGKINAANFKDLKITWAARRTNNFFNGAIDGKSFMMYSVNNGTNWDTLYYLTEPNNSNLWAYVNNGLLINLPAKCNRKADVQLRWLFTGEGLSSSGTYRMDDIRIFATTDTSAIDTSTGFVEINNNIRGLNIYPNPSVNGNINIDANESLNNISVYNLTGEKVFEQQLANVNSYKISALNVKPGIYFIAVASTQGITKKTKIIIDN